MVTNFDYLKTESKFSSFAGVAIKAERYILFDPQTSMMTSRRAMEFAVKWMYSVDNDLERPYEDTLYNLMNAADFRELVGPDILERMNYIRKSGNSVAHNSRGSLFDEAMLCLENLFIFLDFVACCYADNYENREFDKNIILNRKKQAQDKKEKAEQMKAELEKEKEKNAKQELDLERLIRENAALKEQLSAKREENITNYVPKPLEATEYETRKLYIDAMLRDAGWIEGKNWLNEYRLEGMPNKSNVGFADYVLFDDRHCPLAVVEAKKTCVDVSVGRKQANLYADLLEKKFGRRPVIFLTNGFETRIIDGQYQERRVSEVYSKRDFEKLFNLRHMKESLKNVEINKDIAGRYYQEAAIKAVCEAFDEKNRRKALLVMATGSGKTRTVVELCNILLHKGWIKNVLFLTDRIQLAKQAKRSFGELLPNLSTTNLSEEKDNYNAHCVFSTYQTMMKCIDEAKDDEGRLFTSGHFDLIICDEAHRSIYNKYQDIFNYFDSLLVGLTATPKDEIDKNTYDVFELASGLPTYGYDLAQAVEDGFLVNYMYVESKLKFIEDGIVYDDLSDEDKEQYEETFASEDGLLPSVIDSNKLNTWVFNEDTIKKVLHTLMENGIKVDYGQKIGKTIIFAKNHKHAEKILEVFNKEYPHLVGYADVIDNKINYAGKLIDDFSDPMKLPQIAISVDMLDTGIDVPEILNLVFFKKVMSKCKFWQMIGRGTRLCPGLLDGEDKNKFYIFDFCGNFEFFKMNKGKESKNTMAIQGSIFGYEFEIVYKLQDKEFQTERLIQYRNELIKDMTEKVRKLKRDNFAVKQHIKYVDLYSNEDNYQNLTFEDTKIVREELAPLIIPEEGEEVSAVRFDALMYGLELAYLMGRKYTRARSDLFKKVESVSNVSNIAEIQAQSEFIQTLLHTPYIENAGVEDFEEIRERIRGLLKYVRGQKRREYDTNFDDEIISMDWKESELDTDVLKDYKKNAEYYIRKHQDNETIAKLKTNKPLNQDDIKNLENILWKEVGTKEDYEHEYGQKPLGELVREIIGLDMSAAKEAFAKYLNDTSLNSRQIYFVNQIVEYIVHNGMLKDFSVLQESPFSDQGSISEVFDDVNIWFGIKMVIDRINANAEVVV